MLTVAMLAELYGREQDAFVQAGTISPKTAAWNKAGLAHLLGPLGFRPAAELRAYEVTAISYTPHTMKCCKALFRWAVRQDLIARNPFEGIKIPKYKDRSRTMTDAEFRMLRRRIARPYRWLLWFMRRTIARPGELRQAKWSQVHWPTRSIVLMDFKGKERRQEKVRSRSLVLDDRAHRALAWLFRVRRPRPDDFIFPSRTGTEIRKDALCLEFRRTAKRLGINGDIGEKCKPYTVRHTAATRAVENGVGLVDLKELMGHTTVTMTQRYVHLSHDHLLNSINQAHAKKPTLKLRVG